MGYNFDKIHQLNEQAWQGRNNDLHKSIKLARQAETLLADCPEAGMLEMIAGLRTQAYCLNQLGQQREALEIGLRAMDLAIQSGDLLMTMMMDNVLGNIYWSLDDYANALNYFMDGLEIIQKKPDPELEIYLVQGVGIVYFSIGVYEEAFKYFTLSIEIAFPEDCIGRAIGYNNAAYTLSEMKKGQEALPYALKARELFEKGGYAVGLTEVLHTLGSIYLETGDIDQAVTFFDQSLQMAIKNQNHSVEVISLLGICLVHQALGELETARQKLIRILQIAKETGAPAKELCRTHELLAGVYKQMGDHQMALEYYETYHSIYVQMYNEQTYRKIHNAQMLREVETTRKEVELYRQLAATDALTGILSRREFFDLARKAMLRAQSGQSSISLLMLDVDDFKIINDQYGHSVGDQVLAAIAGRLKKSLRQDDLAGRYGGDEFVILLPDTTYHQSLQVAERCRNTVKENPFQVDSKNLFLSISVGLAIYNPPGALDLEDFIHEADQALLAEKKKLHD
jgi:diguanylate cyclase (GGDEF)-like protein